MGCKEWHRHDRWWDYGAGIVYGGQTTPFPMDPGFTADGLDDLLNPIYGASQPIWPGPIRMEVSMTSPEQCKYTN